MSKYAQLTIYDDADPKNNKTIDLPIIEASLGPDNIDTSKLNQNGLFTFDPGFKSTASCKSCITYIDGPAGILRYRGYPIEDLVQHADFLEICQLLLKGDLPNQNEKSKFIMKIKKQQLLHTQLVNFYNGFRRDAHPMAIMCAVVGALSAFYHDSLDINNPEHRELASIRLIAKVPTIAANSYKYSIGEPFIYPEPTYTYAENFLHMMFDTPSQQYEINPVFSQALDKIFTLHADHEQNASTSTVRLAGSSGANPFACIASGIAALWGPAHGGANEAVLKMLNEIGTTDNIAKFIAKAKDPNDPFKLMGFGHRVYKNFDPRATIMRNTCAEVLKEINNTDNHLFAIAQELEKIALNDPYFIEKKLYPNVDFYSGIVLNAIGIPTNMFTVIFAVARTVGWIAQWNEMLDTPNLTINRPRQVYVGHKLREFVSIDKRTN